MSNYVLYIQFLTLLSWILLDTERLIKVFQVIKDAFRKGRKTKK